MLLPEARHAASLGEHVKHVPIKEKDGETEDYLYFDDVRGLLACVQMGTIEFHGWGSRVDKVEYPDRLVFDLDPDVGLDFAKVKEAAVRLRDLLADLGLESFPMLTGGKGIHVVVPLDAAADWPAVKSFADRFSRADRRGRARDASPPTSARSSARAASSSTGCATSAARPRCMPYSARAREGAPVAAPIAWEELDDYRGRQRTSPSATPTNCSSAPRRSCSPAGARPSRRCPSSSDRAGS